MVPSRRRNEMLQHVVLWSLAWLTRGSVAKGNHRHTTLPSHAESLPLQSGGGMNEHKVLYWPLSPRDGVGPTLRILLLPPRSLPPVHQASGLMSAMCHLLPRSVLRGEVCMRWSALSW